MNFYISSRLSNINQVRYVASLLKSNGWTHTCDWTNFNLGPCLPLEEVCAEFVFEAQTDGFEKNLGFFLNLSSEEKQNNLRIIGEKEFDGIKNADIVIVLTPQGRGTHIELGMAIALGKKVYIYHTDDSYFKCDDNTCAFYWLPQVKQLTGKIDTAIEVILQENINPE